MNKKQDIRKRIGITAILLLLLCSLGTTAFARNNQVRVVADANGQKLTVDGRDFMVLGMNWGYMPIGQNYTYSLWEQPDSIIEAALAREMPLLLNMGVNAIRHYTGIPARWVQYIYESYGIYTMLNHPMARYGFTLDGTWLPNTDYSDPKLRAAVKDEIVGIVREFQGVPGVLLWLLGNENNYGLSWSSFEIEALPEGERNTARARHLYSLYDECTRAIQAIDKDRPVAIANGDVQYIDLIAEYCTTLDILGTNVYRGISSRDLFQVVKEKLDIPVMYTEFGSDAWNARDMREDQSMQTRYLLGQWQELYEMSYGKGRVGNAIGGFIFQWSDGWWKFKQEERLDIHDTNASWPNGGYPDDYVEGENNMNEEWWGITAKGPPDHRGLYEVYPRAAYYALREAFELAPYAPDTDLAAIRRHFGAILPAANVQRARGDRAALLAESSSKVRLAGLRIEAETFSTGGRFLETATPGTYPAHRGFDQLQSIFAAFEAKPSEALIGRVELNILGNVPENPIDEIFYENRGRKRSVVLDDGSIYSYEGFDRVKIYKASVTWDDRWFMLNAFHRTGHLHWGFEGDFFGLYRDAYYGENIDIYNGMAPSGVEIEGKRSLTGMKVAFGPQLWWGANPAVLVKYQRQIGPFATTTVLHEDIAPQSNVNTSIAVPMPETRKVSFQAQHQRGPFGIEGGVIWSGQPRVGETFQVAEPTAGGGYQVLQDKILDSDTYGVKAKLTFESGRWHAYAQGAHMGLVAEAGPTETITFTDWALKDSGSGNQNNFITGVARNFGDYQIAPNFLWQKPLIDPMPDVSLLPAPGRKRNVLDDPFAVLANREAVGFEMMLNHDPTPATWMWAWDNVVREDARLAWSLGLVYIDYKTTRDATIFIAEDGVTTYAFGGAPPARSLWALRFRLVSKLGLRSRLVASLYTGLAEALGHDDVNPDPTMNRTIHPWGLDARYDNGPISVAGFLRVDTWGPYDYHRDFNLTYPLQIMGDVSYFLGSPAWFDLPGTKFGVRCSWRSLDEFSPRFVPVGVDPENGHEWEIRTYMHLAI